MGATFASTLLGFLREVVSARYYGTRWEMDTFLAAATIPTILFGVFNGALVSALVPTFSEYIAHREEDEAWRLASTVLNMLAIAVTICAVVGYFTARWYVPLIAHGFPAPQMSVAIRMTRWLMPSIVAVSLSGVLSAMLNAYQRFRSAALVGVAVNTVTIACVVIWSHGIGIYALVLGTALGLTAQMLVQLPSFLSVGKYRPIIDLKHPGLKKIWVLLGPIIVGSAAGQLALFFDRFFASTLAPGYIAGMNYATKLVNFPQQIFAAAIATVIFPLLAAQFARENRRGVARSVVTGLRLVNFITIPSACALIVLSHPMVQALFERGTFQASATDLTAGLLPYASVGLIALGANVVLTRCCFACRETLWPVTISVVNGRPQRAAFARMAAGLGRPRALAGELDEPERASAAAADVNGANRIGHRLGRPGFLDWKNTRLLACDVGGVALDRRPRRYAGGFAGVAGLVSFRSDRHRRRGLRRVRADAQR